MNIAEKYNLNIYKRPHTKSNGVTVVLDSVQHTVLDGSELGILDYVSFCDLAIDASGNLHLVTRMGGGHNNDNNGIIAYLFSNNHGVSWSQYKVIVPTPPDGIVTNPSVCVTQTGRIWVSYGWQHSNKRFIYFVYSDDGGATFTEPTWSTELDAVDRFTADYDDNQITSPTSAIKVDDYLLKVVYARGAGAGSREGRTYKSTDDGLTWTALTAKIFTTNYNNGEEPSIIQLPDGRLFCIVRSDPLQSSAYCWSPDLGVTWTSPLQFCAGTGKPAIACSTKTIVTLNRWAGHGGDSIFNWSNTNGLTWSEETKLLEEEDLYMYGGIVWSPQISKYIGVYCYEHAGSTPNAGPTKMNCFTLTES